MTRPFSVLCPGQGAQAVDIADRWQHTPGLADVQSRFGGPRVDSILRCGDPESQCRTDNAQIALWLEQALWHRHRRPEWHHRGGAGRPTVVAGHSVGEVYALHIAGTLTEVDNKRIVEVRAREIARAAMSTKGSMAAVTGISHDDVQANLTGRPRIPDVWIAAVNASNQVTLTGNDHGIHSALARLTEIDNVRAKRLQTTGAFHSPYMEAAQSRFASSLADIEFQDPSIPMPSNADGRLHTGSEWRRLLSDQVTAPVRWDLCADMVIELSTDDIEFSHRRTLTRLVAQRRALLDRPNP